MLRSLFAPDHRGFYVDVGAHHPYRISNTYLLFKRGWHGINIDPNPDTIALFKKARPHDTNVQLGVSKTAGTLTYHQFADPAVNTFSDTEAEHWKKKTWNQYLGTTTVETKPLKNILSEHAPPNQTIDMLSVDVEGLDLEVLQSNDWNQFKPTVVVVEAHDFEIEHMQDHPLYQYLHGQGYSLKFVVKFSLIFVLKTG
ncbi:FkbM family methyltransferase [Candidatus Nomurabacteria bacterium]|nr:FkbM family methyltransferase [Candidatus Nomurabacteria bacterium]